MPEPLPRTFARVDLGIVRRNFKLLIKGCDGGVPMLKCNAYGHGLVEVARAFEGEAKVTAVGVATLEEGVNLRRAGVKKSIWVFSDCGPWTEDTAALVDSFKLTPVLHTLPDVKAALKDRSRNVLKRTGFHLKFNTGMNRLGLDLADAAEIETLLARAGLVPEGVCSHLAMAEEPKSKTTRSQLARFAEVAARFKDQGAAYIHCANTGALLNEASLKLAKFCNVARPGIGLYGYGGARGETRGLKPALTWQARVVSARELKRGEVVGYGATFSAAANVPQAVLAVGYGDGFKRILSNREILVEASGRARRARVLGRVSMDLTSINCRLKPGTWVTLLGAGSSQGELMARQADTIIYEILTSLSPRVARRYT